MIFAAAVMLTIGAIDIIQGLAALLKDETYAVTESGLLVTTNFTAWGWSLIIWGIVLILAAMALFAGKGWGRWFAIVAILINGIGRSPGSPPTRSGACSPSGLEIAVLYALTAGWKEARDELSGWRASPVPAEPAPACPRGAGSQPLLIPSLGAFVALQVVVLADWPAHLVRDETPGYRFHSDMAHATLSSLL